MKKFVLMVCMAVGLFFVNFTNAAVPVVVEENQPSATLVVPGSVVEFVHFSLFSEEEIEIMNIDIEPTGFGDPSMIKDIFLVAGESGKKSDAYNHEIVGFAIKDDLCEIKMGGNGLIKVTNHKLPPFKGAASFTIAALAKGDLSHHPGQIVTLAIKRILIRFTRTGKFMRITQNLPLSGASHTINASLVIGEASVHGEYQVGHPYAYLNVFAGLIEPVGIEKISFIIVNNDKREEWTGSIFLVYDSEKVKKKITFSREGDFFYLAPMADEPLIAGKNSLINLELQTTSEAGLPDIIFGPENLMVRGLTYGYRIIPEWNISSHIVGVGSFLE